MKQKSLLFIAGLCCISAHIQSEATQQLVGQNGGGVYRNGRKGIPGANGGGIYHGPVQKEVLDMATTKTMQATPGPLAQAMIHIREAEASLAEYMQQLSNQQSAEWQASKQLNAPKVKKAKKIKTTPVQE